MKDQGVLSAARTLAIVVGAALALSGCASWVSPQPPEAPKQGEVRKEIEELHRLKTGSNTNAGTVSATQIATAGYSLADRQCTNFFDAVHKWNNDSNFNRKELALLGAGAAGILAALKSSAQTIAITAIAVTLAADSIDNFQNFALAAARLPHVRRLVTDAQTAYRRSAPPTSAAVMTDEAVAYDYLGGYAALCTYDGIQSFVNQALAAGQPEDTNGPASIFAPADRVILAAVNAALGLTDATLSDEKYVELYWFLKDAHFNEQHRNNVLKNFDAIRGKLYDQTNQKLTSDAEKALSFFEVIARGNRALDEARLALDKANKDTATYVNTAPLPRPKQIPNIQIRPAVRVIY
jgi:hypothetical protein